MAINYAKLKQTADRLIAENGVDISFFRDGAKYAGGKGLFVESEGRTETGSTTSALANTQRTGKQMLVRSLKVSIQTGDQVTYRNETYTVVAVRELKPTTVTIYAELEVV